VHQPSGQDVGFQQIERFYCFKPGGFRDIGGLGASSPRKFLKLRSFKMGYPEF